MKLWNLRHIFCTTLPKPLTLTRKDASAPRKVFKANGGIFQTVSSKLYTINKPDTRNDSTAMPLSRILTISLKKQLT